MILSVTVTNMSIMSIKIPLFFPAARIVKSVDVTGSVKLSELLRRAGAPCRASGRWSERLVVIAPGESGIEREPGDWGAVRIGVPSDLGEVDAARFAASAMAYGLMDLVARESIRGAYWARPAAPRGRPPTGRALSNAERQRNFRARHKA